MSQPAWIVTAKELHSALEDGQPLKLVDVREPEEYAESRIEGCTLIPLGEITGRASELNANDDIVLYCAHGVRSVYALQALQRLGFKKLRSLEGGIVEWQSQGY